MMWIKMCNTIWGSEGTFSWNEMIKMVVDSWLGLFGLMLYCFFLLLLLKRDFASLIQDLDFFNHPPCFYLIIIIYEDW